MKDKSQEIMKTGVFYRNAEFDRATADKDERTIDLSFSSEAPYERYFGIEILDHGSGVDLSFLDSGRAPLLKNHWTDEQVGVIEKAWIGPDRKGRASVRFGKSELAEQEFQDVLDDIRVNISVGYRVLKMVLESSDEETGETYRVTEWKPLEISIVSIPADETVGVGRNQEFETIVNRPILTREVNSMNEDEKRALEAQAVRENEARLEAVKVKAETEARTSEKNRVKELIAIGEIHNMREQALKAVDSGESLESFRGKVLETLAERNQIEEVTETAELGLNSREVRQYDFFNIVRALANPTDRRLQEAASFEFECSKAMEDKLRKSPQGMFIPTDILIGRDLRHPANQQRDVNVGTATAGGYLVGENLMVGSFIEILKNSMVVAALGAQVLRDLIGDVAIPKQTGGATGYWVGEGDDVTESAQTFGQVTLRPKTVGAFTDITRRTIIQSSMDVEALIRDDLIQTLALKVDLAALNGAGTPHEPLGIMGTSGVGSVTLNAANTPDWGDIVDLESAVAVDNALTGSLAYTANATIQGKMKQTEKASSTGRFILEGNELNGYPFVMSNQVPAKYLLFGNWRELLIGYWSGLDLNVDTSTLSKSGGLRLVALQDVDIAVRHAESFAVGYKA